MHLAVVAWPEPHPLGPGDEKREGRALTPCRAALSRPCPGRRFSLYLRRQRESRFPGRRRKTGQRGKLRDCLPRDTALESLALGAGRLLPSVCLPYRKQLLWGSINSLRGKQTGPEAATTSL